MLHKKSKIDVSNRRSVAAFFNRMQEVFERKFDGFPATVEGDTMPAMHDESIAEDAGIELDITGYLDVVPQCPDQSVDDCYGTPETQPVILEDALTTHGWGQAKRVIYRPAANQTQVALGLGSGSDGLGYVPFVSSLSPERHTKWFITFHQDFLSLSGGRIRMRAMWESTDWHSAGAAPTTVTAKVYKDVITSMPSDGITGGNISGWTGGTLVGTVTFVANAGGPPGSGVQWRDTNFRSLVIGNLEMGTSFQSKVLRLETEETYPQLTLVPYRNEAGTARGPELTTNTIQPGSPAGDSPCKGDSVAEELVLASAHAHGAKEYEASLPVNYFVSVWVNGLIMVKDVDYSVTVDNHILIDPGPDAGSTVTARYVVG